MSTAPTVVFIDDSATMREVIKIAFRRENIDVVAYPDATTALPNIEQGKPDVVITDVIMPDKDGYEVCQHIKQHPRLGNTPVILMSGVVNRAVAEKAFAVKADELIRKPFQPQDLITRVKHLLKQETEPGPVAPPANAAAALSNIFAAPQGNGGARPKPQASPAPLQAAMAAPVPVQERISAPLPANPGAKSAAMASNDVTKLRMEIGRLEGLVKKLQSELAAEREYVRSLEEHFKTAQQQ